VPLSQLTGAFYFSGPDSLELMTKILDQGGVGASLLESISTSQPNDKLDTQLDIL
jgi:hypothetical protein